MPWQLSAHAADGCPQWPGSRLCTKGTAAGEGGCKGQGEEGKSKLRGGDVPNRTKAGQAAGMVYMHAKYNKPSVFGSCLDKNKDDGTDRPLFGA